MASISFDAREAGFKESLAQLSKREIGTGECARLCADVCLSRIEQTAPGQNPLSLCDKFLAQFKADMETQKIQDPNLERLFKETLAYRVNRSWAAHFAQAFLRIKDNPHEVSSWGARFRQGAKVLASWQGRSFSHGMLFGLILDAQHEYEKAWLDSEMRKIARRWKADPKSLSDRDNALIENVLAGTYIGRFWVDAKCRIPDTKGDLRTMARMTCKSPDPKL